jgi:hypothetical protein
MTAKTRWTARLTATALTVAAIAIGSLGAATPAHANRAQDCQALLDSGQVDFRMYEWYRVFYGADSWEARGHLKASIDAADNWLLSC